MKAITIKQPWAQLIARRLKHIENRSWVTSYRGPLIIQASMQDDPVALEVIEDRFGVSINRNQLHRGVIVAIADLVDIVDDHPSLWFVGPYGWILRNIRPLPAMPMRGKLSIFDPPPHIRSAVLKHLED